MEIFKKFIVIFVALSAGAFGDERRLIPPQESFVNTFFDICPSKVKGALSFDEFLDSEVCQEWLNYYLIGFFRESKFTGLGQWTRYVT